MAQQIRAGKDLEAGTDGGALLTGLLGLLSYITQGHLSRGVTTHTVGWAFPHQPLIKKWLTVMFPGQPDRSNSLVDTSSINSSLCQADKDQPAIFFTKSHTSSPYTLYSSLGS